MDPKLVAVVVFLIALAITSTHAGIPSCCVKTTKPRRSLLKAERWERQYSTGACDIDALVVYVKNRSRPFCVDPKLEKFLERTKRHLKQQQKNRTRGV